MPNKPTMPDAPEIAAPPAPSPSVASILATDTTPTITEAGALENSPEFIQAAQDAWNATQRGNSREETGFAVGPDGKPGKMLRTEDGAEGGHISARIPSNSVALLHIHNNSLEAKPSPDDIESAKKWQRPMYVLHRNGLDHIDATGHVTRVKNGTSWLYQKPKAAAKNSNNKKSDSKKTIVEVHGDVLKSGRNSDYRRAFIARGQAGKHSWK
jgi:hypothetical protein